MIFLKIISKTPILVAGSLEPILAPKDFQSLKQPKPTTLLQPISLLPPKLRLSAHFPIISLLHPKLKPSAHFPPPLTLPPKLNPPSMISLMTYLRIIRWSPKLIKYSSKPWHHLTPKALQNLDLSEPVIHFPRTLWFPTSTTKLSHPTTTKTSWMILWMKNLNPFRRALWKTTLRFSINILKMKNLQNRLNKNPLHLISFFLSNLMILVCSDYYEPVPVRFLRFKIYDLYFFH